MIKKKDISSSDIKDWEDYIQNPRDIFDKEKNKTKSVNYRFRYDFHGYTLENANAKVKDIIFNCSKNNYQEILLITGKGIHSNTKEEVYVSQKYSKLRYSIPDYIKSDDDIRDLISSIKVASLKDGGDGAILIKLKKL